MQFAICAAVVICGLVLPADAQQSETPAATIGTVKAERRPIEKTLELVGRVEAIDRVEIRARVKGYLEAVLFEEGGKVKEGDPLYHIEKDQFQAQVGQAHGLICCDRARDTAVELDPALLKRLA
jgi:membrane fusion protein (multidrug efflux system)